MNVACRLRDLRGRVSLKEMERLTGINRGALSRYERGREFPPDREIATLEQAYGAPQADWYDHEPAPHRERKPRPKPTGIRITLRPDELAILRTLVGGGRHSWVNGGALAGEVDAAHRLTNKIVRAADRAEAA